MPENNTRNNALRGSALSSKTTWGCPATRAWRSHKRSLAPPVSNCIMGTAMHVINSFIRPEEQALADEFAANGYVVRPVDDREALDELRRFVAQTVCDQLKMQLPNDVDDFLNHVERVVPIEKLNEVRLNTYRKMNAAPWFRSTYFGLARSTIETLVGNELAMQNRVNLSIQLPRDDLSLLAIHADAFGGETPFQVVEWLPLVDCYKTKSMFVLPRAKSEAADASFTRYEGKGMDYCTRTSRKMSSGAMSLTVTCWYSHRIISMVA